MQSTTTAPTDLHRSPALQAEKVTYQVRADTPLPRVTCVNGVLVFVFPDGLTMVGERASFYDLAAFILGCATDDGPLPQVLTDTLGGAA